MDSRGNNITVGEIGLTWELVFVSNTSEYDFYEFALHELVRGSAADIGEVGWIESGQTLIDLRSDSLMVREWSETHGEGAVHVSTSTDSNWNGSIRWQFEVLQGSGSFNPRAASNLIGFTVFIRVIHGANLNLTIHAVTDWSIYGYSFDRTLVRGAETIVIDVPSQTGTWLNQ